jgi:hypothetical protein
MKHYLIIVLLFWQAHGLAHVSIEVEPQTASINEPIRLTVSLDNAQNNVQPDLTPLQKKFIITGTATRISYTSVNGLSQSLKQWVVLLMPKQSGTITIPAIQIGQERTHPITIQVSQNALSTSANPHTASNDNKSDSIQAHSPVMLRTTIDKKNVFINEQIIYTVRLYNSQPLANVEYQAPAIKNSLFFPIGNGRRYHETIQGQLYEVDEQQYAIFPQKSGTLTITPPTFNAIKYDTTPQPIHIVGNRYSLQIKPIPTNNQAFWLPAKQVTLTEHYDIQDNTLKLGQTLVRTISFEATGIPAELMPDLTFAPQTGLNIYPNKAEVEDSLQQQNLVGKRTYTITYLFNQAGIQTIPALTLSWHNTTTHVDETVSLPERQITISATKNQTTKDSKPTSQIQSMKKETTTSINHYLKQGLCIILFLSGLLLIGYCGFRYYTRPHQRLCRQLRDACMTNDANHAQTLLLQWAANLVPDKPCINLAELSQIIDDSELKTAIHELSAALYNPNHKQKSWKGQLLWKKIKRYNHKSHRRVNKKQPIPPLHYGQDTEN